MGRRIIIELSSRNDFWRNAFFVEWNHQFPGRSIEPPDEKGTGLAAHLLVNLLVNEEWLDDLERVASQCFSEVRQAPADPGRRQIFRRIFTSGRR